MQPYMEMPGGGDTQRQDSAFPPVVPVVVVVLRGWSNLCSFTWLTYRCVRCDDFESMGQEISMLCS
jgi:hypothetical protein